MLRVAYGWPPFLLAEYVHTPTWDAFACKYRCFSKFPPVSHAVLCPRRTSLIPPCLEKRSLVCCRPFVCLTSDAPTCFAFFIGLPAVIRRVASAAVCLSRNNLVPSRPLLIYPVVAFVQDPCSTAPVLAAACCCLLGLWPCSFIPFLIPDLRDTVHRCPSCHATVGRSRQF